MDVKAVANVQAATQTNAQSAEIMAKEVQKSIQGQNDAMQNPSQASAAMPTAEELTTAMNDIQERLNTLNGELTITTDDDTGVRVVKIVEKNSEKVIRQIPSEAVLKIAKYLDEIAGLLYNEKV